MTSIFILSKEDMLKCPLKNVSITPNWTQNKPSFAWKYFGPVKAVSNSRQLSFEPKRVFCIECLERAKRKNPDDIFNLADIKSFSGSTGTGNMTSHLEKEHNIRDGLAVTVLSSKTMQSFFDPIPKVDTRAFTSAAQRKRKLVVDIVMLCCRDLYPFNAVEGKGFFDFCQKYGVVTDQCDMPSRTTISRCLDFVYQHCKAEVIKSVAEHSPKDVSFTFDQWTDRYRRRPYNTNTLHYWDDDFNAVNLTLKTSHFPKRHTGENILAEIESIIDEFGIQDKNVHMITDAARNVRKACRLGKYDNHLCWGHGMHNLVFTDGIKKTKDVYDIIYRVRQIVKCLRYKTDELNSLEQEMADVSETNPYFEAESEDDETDDEESDDEYATINEGKLKSLKLDVVTRWYSQHFMMDSVQVRGRQQINAALQRYGRDDLCLSRNDFELITDLCVFFKHFQRITEILSGETYSTINMACVFRCELSSVLENDTNDREEITLLKRNMRNQFDKRLPINELMVVASLLDPRFQNLLEINDFLKRQNTNAFELLKKWASECFPENNVQTGGSNSGDRRTTFIDDLIEKHSTLSSVRQSMSIDCELSREIHFLLSLGSNVKVESIRLFWKSYSSQMPILSILARKILSIPMTSTPSERNFSISGLIANSRKSSILPSNLDKMLFIHNNYEFCKNIACDKFKE